MDLRDELQSALGSAYSLERELGGGGMSRVFVAEEAALERKVVVKVLHPELAAGVNVDRFRREILLAARLQNPHIVPLLAAGEASGLPYYTMPFVEGESLRERLAKAGALPITAVVGVLRDVARALAYAHERGVVHRDIKPENVLLSAGSAVVTDFGIAKALSAARGTTGTATLTQVGTSLGTPAYMAPEQAAADPAADHRVDLYAFGCLAYEMLGGRPPFVEKTPQRLLAAHMGDTPVAIAELRPDTPPALADLVMRCLAKDAADRPRSAADLVSLLDTVTSGGGQAAMPAALLASPHSLRRALGIYALAFVAVAVVARAAIVGIGLPDWVFPGALVVMALGLPVILFTGYVHHATRRLVTMTPTYTPGGTAAPRGTLATMALRASPHVSWRRTTLGGAWAVGAFVFLVGVFMVLRALGIGPAGSLLAAGKLGANEPLLVSEFHATAGADSALGAVVAEGLRTDLGQSNVVRVVPTSVIQEALQKMQRAPGTRVDAVVAREIAEREGIRAIVTGDITRLGSGFVVTARLVGTRSGNDLASFQETADAPSQLIPTVDRLSRDLRGKIGESLRAVQGSPRLEDVTTASLDALEAYTAAQQPFNADDFLGAIQLLRRAVQLDPTFAMAWRKLGISEQNSGMSAGLADSAFIRAYQNREHLTARERNTTAGSYFFPGPGYDRLKAIEPYQAAVALGDYDVAGHNLGTVYTRLRRYAAADSMFRLVIRNDPGVTWVTYEQLVAALLEQGKLDAADSVLAAARRRFGPLAAQAGVGAVLLAARGHFDSAQTLLSRTQPGGAPVGVRAGLLRTRSYLAEVRGQLQASSRDLAAEAALLQPTGVPGLSLADSLASAYNDAAFRREPARAVNTLDAALAATPLRTLPPLQRPYVAAVHVYALAGRPDRGRALLAQMDADVRDTIARRQMQGERHDALGWILLAEKRALDAVREFRASDSLTDGPARECAPCVDADVGLAFDAAGSSDSAITYFRRYLEAPFPPAFAGGAYADYLALVDRRLGELYEARGDHASAARYYARFVDLWKNADPDLQPQVADVSRRLTRLGQSEAARRQ